MVDYSDLFLTYSFLDREAHTLDNELDDSLSGLYKCGRAISITKALIFVYSSIAAHDICTELASKF